MTRVLVNAAIAAVAGFVFYTAVTALEPEPVERDIYGRQIVGSGEVRPPAAQPRSQHEAQP